MDPMIRSQAGSFSKFPHLPALVKIYSYLHHQVRASNMVRAGESLMKLVSDLKQYLILNDFPSVNEAISQNSNMFKDMQVLINWMQHSGKQNAHIHTIWVTNTMWLVYYVIHPITWIFKTPHPQAIKRICPLGLVRLGTSQLTQLPPHFVTLQI